MAFEAGYFTCMKSVSSINIWLWPWCTYSTFYHSQWLYMSDGLWAQVVIVLWLIENWDAGSQWMKSWMKSWVKESQSDHHVISVLPCLCFHYQKVRSDFDQHTHTYTHTLFSSCLTYFCCLLSFLLQQFSTFNGYCHQMRALGEYGETFQFIYFLACLTCLTTCDKAPKHLAQPVTRN